MKKSIAVLSLGIAATLGLAACGETTQTTTTSNGSASTRATASVSSSPLATSASSDSQPTSSEAPAKAEEEKTGADSPQEDSAKQQAAAEESSQPADSTFDGGNQKSFKETTEEAKKSPAARKSTNADGTVYTSSLGDEIAIVEANNGDDIIIKKDGSWSRLTPEKSFIAVEADGSWHVITANGRLINVDADGLTKIIDFDHEVNEDSYASLDIPQTPAPVAALKVTPKEPAKPTKMAHSWGTEWTPGAGEESVHSVVFRVRLTGLIRSDWLNTLTSRAYPNVMGAGRFCTYRCRAVEGI